MRSISSGVTRLLLTGAILLVVGMLVPVSPAHADSASCSPAKAAMQSGNSIRKITSGGQERSYVMHIPATYDPAKSTSLVISFHGFASNAAEQVVLTKWNEVSDKENFVVVYPQALETPPRWHLDTVLDEGKIDDVAFIRDLIAQLSNDLCLDPTHIFANGMSNGGGMTNLLACRLADQLAAVGMVSGQYAPMRGGCNPARPIPVMAFHGTGDIIVPYDGKKILAMPPILDWIAEWAKRNGCDAVPKKLDTKGDVSGIQYPGCKDGADVILYTIDGGGHTWPGGLDVPVLGKTSTDINASETLWDFYVAHPLSAPEGN